MVGADTVHRPGGAAAVVRLVVSMGIYAVQFRVFGFGSAREAE